MATSLSGECLAEAGKAVWELHRGRFQKGGFHALEDGERLRLIEDAMLYAVGSDIPDEAERRTLAVMLADWLTDRPVNHNRFRPDNRHNYPCNLIASAPVTAYLTAVTLAGYTDKTYMQFIRKDDLDAKSAMTWRGVADLSAVAVLASYPEVIKSKALGEDGTKELLWAAERYLKGNVRTPGFNYALASEALKACKNGLATLAISESADRVDTNHTTPAYGASSTV